MENKDDELHLKQNYLKHEILDKDIDQNKFLDYCISIKENGDDINSWTFDELKECVANFNKLLEQEYQKKEEQKSAQLNSFLSNTNMNININTNSQPQNQNQSNLKNIAYNISKNISKNITNLITQNQNSNKFSAISLNPLQPMINNEKMRQKIDT